MKHGEHGVRVDGAEAVRYARELGVGHVQVEWCGEHVGVDVNAGDACETLLRRWPGALFLDIDRRGTRYDTRFSAAACEAAVYRARYGRPGIEFAVGGYWLEDDSSGLSAFSSAVLDERRAAGDTARWSVVVERMRF